MVVLVFLPMRQGGSLIHWFHAWDCEVKARLIDSCDCHQVGGEEDFK